MNNYTNSKKYLIVTLIQLIVIASFTGIMYFVFNNESVVLNPIPYTVAIAVAILLVNYIILIKVLNEDQEKEETIEEEYIE